MGRAGRRMDAQHGRGATVGRVGDALDKLFFRFHAVDAGGQHFVEPRESERFPKGDGLLARACLHGLSSLLARGPKAAEGNRRSEEHTSELQSLMRISYAVFCLKKKKKTRNE